MFYRVRLRQQWSAPVELGVILSLVIGLVAISFSPIFIRLSEGEISPYSTIFNRFWIATVALGLWNGISTKRPEDSVSFLKKQPVYSVQTLGLLLGLGTLLSTSLIVWAWSLTETSVANSAIIHSLTPIFTALWGWLFLKRQIDGKFLMGMAIAVGGTLVIGFHDLSHSDSRIQGDLAALFSALLLGGYPLIVEQLKSRISPKEIIKGCSIVGMLITLPVVILTGEQLFPHTIHGWFAVISLAVICQIIGLGLEAVSLKRFSPEFISTCHLVTPILGSIAAWGIFGEILSPDNWIGFTCVLLGIYVTLLSRSAVKPQDAVNPLPLD
ncbi:DMT family transporter [Capilliphycus salinus ALCB114379]|uniref:DMT family transporter n=1 Tax=Capilliphycus salinus TaxID=2768948 RepID=UPI0039A5C3B1